MRSILTNNDMRDGWIYWGYGLHQHPTIVNRLMHTLLGPKNGSDCEHASRPIRLRLFAEHHYSRHSVEAVLGQFGPFSPLQRVAARCRCRIVLATRLREPLSFYTSFYRWTVNWRQQRNASTFGHDMLEWAPRNLQASMFLNPLDATWAEFVGVHADEAKMRRQIYSQFDEPGGPHPGSTAVQPKGLGAKRRDELRRVLASYDLVGLLERFDETLLLLADLTGIQRLLYTRFVPGTTNPHYEQPSVSQVCPDRSKCEKRIREVAPLDHEMYSMAAAAFEQRVKSQGEPFQKRLAAFKEALSKHQASMKAKKAREEKGAPSTMRVIERSTASPTEMHHRVPMARLHCRIGHSVMGSEACQRIYADTPFRYNWRHTRSSCCQRLSHCVRVRLGLTNGVHRRFPPSCHRWMPASIADLERDDLIKHLFGKAGSKLRITAKRRIITEIKTSKEVNATLLGLCHRECVQPPDPEPVVSPPYRVPSESELAALPTPLIIATQREQGTPKGVYGGGGNEYDGSMAIAALPPDRVPCNDTHGTYAWLAGKPWLDFDTCAVEGETRENLQSTFGPCGRDLWMRVNCRRTCGLCGFGLREMINLKPWQALKAARLAAKARGSKALIRFDAKFGKKQNPCVGWNCKKAE